MFRTVKRMEDVRYAVTRILYLGPHHSLRTVKNKQAGRQLSRTVKNKLEAGNISHCKKRIEDVRCAVTRILYLGPHHSLRNVKNKQEGRQLSRTVKNKLEAGNISHCKKRIEDVRCAVTRILYLEPHHSLRNVKNKQEGRKLSRIVKRMQDVQCAVTRILYLGPHHSLRTIKNKLEAGNISHCKKMEDVRCSIMQILYLVPHHTSNRKLSRTVKNKLEAGNYFAQ